MRRLVLVPTLLIAGLALAGTVWLMRGVVAEDLLLNPALLDFGVVGVGEEAQQVAIATNTSGDLIEIDEIRLPQGFRASRDGLRLEPGESAEIVVTFRSETAGEVEGKLVLASGSRRSRAVDLRAVAQLPPALEVAPRAISFGEVGVGRSGMVEVVVSNRGQGELRIEALVAPKPFRVSAATLQVPAGESRTVDVSFAPEKVGDFDRMLALRSNDPEQPIVQVRLGGTALERAPEPRIEVDPLALDFGRVTSCTGPLRWVSVRNEGTDPLTLSAFRYPEGFIGPARSRSVAAGREFSFPVTFAPRRAGRVGGELKIFSNDPDTAMVTVGLTGDGAACSEEAVAQLASRRPTFSGSGGSGGSSTGSALRAGGGRGGFSSSGLQAGEPGAAPAEAAAGEEAAPAEPPPLLGEDSFFRLASYESKIPPLNAEVSAYDPDTGDLRIEGLQLPPIDAALGEFFQSDPIDIVGRVDSLGEIEVPISLRIYDSYGNPIDVQTVATTGTISTPVDGGQVITRQGVPFGTGADPKLIFLATFPEGSTLAGQQIWGQLAVNE